MFKNKTIFITGAGSIGSIILEQLLNYDVDSIRIFDNSELKLHDLKQKYKNSKRKIKYILGDIRDKDRLSIAIRDVNIVFHTAALKHVHFCEDNPVDAVKTNVMATQNLIDVCIKEDVERVMNISTDKAANPINVMGATKLLTERMMKSASKYRGKGKTIFTTVRFGNVLDSSGSVVPIFRDLIKTDKVIPITDLSMTRFMMSIKDAVDLVFEATKLSQGEDIFILKMQSIKIIDLANAMMQKYNKNVGIEIVGLQTEEKIHEALITEEESKSAYENDTMIVIPSKKDTSYYKKRGFKKLKVGSITSDKNNILSVSEIKELL